MPEESRKKSKSPEETPSALHVMPGVEGGHDGLPSGKSSAAHVRKRGGPTTPRSTEEFVRGIIDGDRTMLGRAITLIESDSPTHQDQAQEVLKAIMPQTGKSIRVGITGVPGAGKSTFIETFGVRLTQRGHKVAVMAVDPSSSITRGSILGDKTRMEQLAREPNAFIRPSPSGGTLGGVARKTRETMLVFEAAGYDVILVETIGVGQSEITVRSMVDFFLLILIAGAGDELQGLKRGVMEIADAVVVNKADGRNLMAARRARAEYERALHYLMPATRGWQTGAFMTSAVTGEGINQIWEVIQRFRDMCKKSGFFDKRRREQTREWLHSMLEEKLRDSFYHHPVVSNMLPDIECAVMEGNLPATQAARQLLKAFETRRDEH